MSENLTILEGELGRQFAPVDRLSIDNQGGGVSPWVIADYLDISSLSADENGLYLATEEDCDCFDEVEVDVSTEIEDGDYKKITGKDPNDGNDYAVGLDEEGNLTKEKIPSAIHIVIKPRKLEYEDGDIIDYTGIHVYLMDGNNQRFTSEDYPTGEIPFEELLLPVTIAEGGEESGEESGEEYSDGDGVTAIGLIGSPDTESSYATTFGTVGGNEIGCYNDAVGLLLLATKYNGNVYFAGRNLEESETKNLGSFSIRTESFSWISTLSVQRLFARKWGLNTESQAFTWVPESTKDPTSIDPESLEEVGIEIPVQWMRSDGEMLEDKFIISVSNTEDAVSWGNSTDPINNNESGHTSGGF